MQLERGFTVVELLISVSIFALILTGLTVALIQQQRQMIFTRESVDLDQTARATLDLVASEIRNAAARQGKNFSVEFTNGGSQADGTCGAVTTDAGTTNSPPDCLTVFTWDNTRGQFVDATDTDSDGDVDEIIMPSIKAEIDMASQTGSSIVLNLPDSWFLPSGQPILSAGDLLGFRSRISLCSLDPLVDCLATPSACTECAAILKVTSVDSALKRATIDTSQGSPLIAQNFVDPPPAVFSDFVSNFFAPSIAAQISEMSIIRATSFSIRTSDDTFMIDRNLSGTPEEYAGGPDAPSVVDMQLVFNLENPDGSTTKVGVATDAANNMFASFSEAAVDGRQKDIRTVEIYLLVKSRLRPQLIRGTPAGEKTVPQIGDRTERTTAHSSLGEGYVYKVFTTTVYVRNMAREEYG